MNHAEHFRAIFDFIAGTGIRIEETALSTDTFLPGVAVRWGALLVDPSRLLWPGDLLHEAGHLAVLPAHLRQNACDDQPNLLGAEFAGEQEAMAWAYAAAVALQLPIEVLLHEGGYQGKSAELAQMYRFGVYPGLRGLCLAGMTAAPGFAEDASGLSYPQMRSWLRV